MRALILFFTLFLASPALAQPVESFSQLPDCNMPCQLYINHMAWDIDAHVAEFGSRRPLDGPAVIKVIIEHYLKMNAYGYAFLSVGYSSDGPCGFNIHFYARYLPLVSWRQREMKKAYNVCPPA